MKNTLTVDTLATCHRQWSTSLFGSLRLTAGATAIIKSNQHFTKRLLKKKKRIEIKQIKSFLPPVLSIHKTNQTRDHSYDLSSAQRAWEKKKRKKVWLLEKAALALFHLSFTALMSKSLPLIKVKAGHFSVLRNKATRTKWKQASSEWAQSSVKRLQWSEFSATSRRLSFTLNGVKWTRTHITTVIFKHLSHSSLSPLAPQPLIPPSQRPPLKPLCYFISSSATGYSERVDDSTWVVGVRYETAEGGGGREKESEDRRIKI